MPECLVVEHCEPPIRLNGIPTASQTMDVRRRLDWVQAAFREMLKLLPLESTDRIVRYQTQAPSEAKTASLRANESENWTHQNMVKKKRERKRKKAVEGLWGQKKKTNNIQAMSMDLELPSGRKVVYRC
ncbi:hypothetical protein PCH_Pc21g22310 [Penicillium rubens Wisconsin 54-1255]|uniref:Uncharacterized protein n=1 Tax=Penicillium rubens (strain ATCC 28089 / DSM 1075 / NRRL 1951 / Wisconsin 54-1255) TaxID=500485 RepID=B6HN11_PENRW|nr:hypothetical protein PCH_Pc21g22310 [Penicillium rubens Wisconsin 54-1255]